MIELPKQLEKCKATPIFTEHTLPKGLQETHKTKAGTWARIVIHEGTIVYMSERADWKRELISAGQHVIIQPEEPHHLKLCGSVSLKIEFYR